MGVPGPTTSASSVGVHQLLREGSGVLVTDGNDVLELIGSAGEFAPVPPRVPQRRRDRLPVVQQRLLDAFEVGRGLTVDEVATRARLGLLEVSAALDRLSRDGWVRLAVDGWRLTEHALPGMSGVSLSA
jgi:DNA processing protein